MLPLLSLIPLIAQGAAGLGQTIAGIKGMSAQRPTYSMPDEVKQRTAIASSLANNDMPNYGTQREMNEQATANAYRAAQEGGIGIGGLSTIQANQNAGYRSISDANNQWKANQMQNWQSALADQAKYADQEWQMNEYAPYADKVQQGRQMFGAGLSNLIGAGTSFAGASQYQDLLNAYKAKMGDMGGSAGINGAIQQSLKMPVQWDTQDFSVPASAKKTFSFMPNLSQLPS